MPERLFAALNGCTCGKNNFLDHNIKEMVTLTKVIRKMVPMTIFPYGDVFSIEFERPLTYVGLTGRMAGPYWYFWIPKTGDIWYEEELNSITKEKRVVLAATNAVDPSRALKVAKFISIGSF
jgi:hypothetical protein